jgi:hypothetical protein
MTILLRRQITRERHRERERERGDDKAQRKRRRTKRERDSKANLLPAKICFYFHHLPLLPLLLPIFIFPGWTEPKLKSDFLLAALSCQQPNAQKLFLNAFSNILLVLFSYAPTTTTPTFFFPNPKTQKKYFIHCPNTCSKVFWFSAHNFAKRKLLSAQSFCSQVYYSLPQ